MRNIQWPHHHRVESCADVIFFSVCCWPADLLLCRGERWRRVLSGRRGVTCCTLPHLREKNQKDTRSFLSSRCESITIVVHIFHRPSNRFHTHTQHRHWVELFFFFDMYNNNNDDQETLLTSLQPKEK